jgi:hypothetical protein
MPVIVFAKYDYTGVVNITKTNQEIAVVDIPPQSDDYMVEGYVDLSSLQQGDVLVVTEYMALDGISYKSFASYSFSGPLPTPIYRFHTKTLYKGMAYRITVKLVAGTTPKSVPYAFILEVLASV